MSRFVISIIIGVVIGVPIGLLVGWQIVPVEYVDIPIQSLPQTYHDEYTTYIAAGYFSDRDVNGAIERLHLLGIQNIPEYVQLTTERFITNSRNVQDIQYLVHLAEGLGRLTPLMEPYRRVQTSGGSP